MAAAEYNSHATGHLPAVLPTRSTCTSSPAGHAAAACLAAAPRERRHAAPRSCTCATCKHEAHSGSVGSVQSAQWGKPAWPGVGGLTEGPRGQARQGCNAAIKAEIISYAAHHTRAHAHVRYYPGRVQPQANLPGVHPERCAPSRMCASCGLPALHKCVPALERPPQAQVMVCGPEAHHGQAAAGRRLLECLRSTAVGVSRSSSSGSWWWARVRCTAVSGRALPSKPPQHRHVLRHAAVCLN